MVWLGEFFLCELVRHDVIPLPVVWRLLIWVGCSIMLNDRIPHRGVPVTRCLDPGHLCLSIVPCSWSRGPTCLLGAHSTFTSLSLKPPCHFYYVTVLSNFLLQMPCANRRVAIVSSMTILVSCSCCLPDQHVCVSPDHLMQQVLSEQVSALQLFDTFALIYFSSNCLCHLPS